MRFALWEVEGDDGLVARYEITGQTCGLETDFVPSGEQVAVSAVPLSVCLLALLGVGDELLLQVHLHALNALTRPSEAHADRDSAGALLRRKSRRGGGLILRALEHKIGIRVVLPQGKLDQQHSRSKRLHIRRHIIGIHGNLVCARPESGKDEMALNIGAPGARHLLGLEGNLDIGDALVRRATFGR